MSALSDLAAKCREELEALPEKAMPTWYRLHGRQAKS